MPMMNSEARKRAAARELLTDPRAEARRLADEWDREADRSKRTRTMFAQEAIRTDVAASWIDACQSIGKTVDVERFVTRAVETLGGIAKSVEKPGGRTVLSIDLTGTEAALRAALPEGQIGRAHV